MESLQKQILNKSILPEDPQEILGTAKQLEQVMMKYNCAIREVKTKLEVLNDELSIQNQRNPIEFIKTRVKKPGSIISKLIRKGFDISLQSVQENLNDVAGVRVVCSFVDDIYAVAEMITKQDDVTLIEVKDYIKNPKPNGYRSLHLIIEIPVFFSNTKDHLRCEVQIRTIAMDFWASLEHDLKYKQEFSNVDVIQEELRQCAETIAMTDARMMEIRDKIEVMKNGQDDSEEERLLS
ncbi:MAG: GTP pyrophosphokinase family protein [Firmicutes bacterium]|nr:GTP pyrophosphokinase family protein [Bacillota bacterium]